MPMPKRASEAGSGTDEGTTVTTAPVVVMVPLAPDAAKLPLDPIELGAAVV